MMLKPLHTIIVLYGFNSMLITAAELEQIKPSIGERKVSMLSFVLDCTHKKIDAQQEIAGTSGIKERLAACLASRRTNSNNQQSMNPEKNSELLDILGHHYCGEASWQNSWPSTFDAKKEIEDACQAYNLKPYVQKKFKKNYYNQNNYIWPSYFHRIAKYSQDLGLFITQSPGVTPSSFIRTPYRQLESKNTKDPVFVSSPIDLTKSMTIICDGKPITIQPYVSFLVRVKDTWEYQQALINQAAYCANEIRKVRKITKREPTLEEIELIQDASQVDIMAAVIMHIQKYVLPVTGFKNSLPSKYDSLFEMLSKDVYITSALLMASKNGRNYYTLFNLDFFKPYLPLVIQNWPPNLSINHLTYPRVWWLTQFFNERRFDILCARDKHDKMPSDYVNYDDYPLFPQGLRDMHEDLNRLFADLEKNK